MNEINLRDVESCLEYCNFIFNHYTFENTIEGHINIYMDYVYSDRELISKISYGTFKNFTKRVYNAINEVI